MLSFSPLKHTSHVDRGYSLETLCCIFHCQFIKGHLLKSDLYNLTHYFTIFTALKELSFKSH